MTDTSAPFDAIVLAGGRSRRMGGSDGTVIDKAVIELGEQRLVDRVVGAVRTAGAGRVIVAGPARTGTLADAMVREDPPFAGPVAALDAALPEVRESWVLVLACDLVHPDEVAQQLLASVRADASKGCDGAILVDETGHRQWLAARYRTDRLREVLGAVAEGASAGAENAGAGAARSLAGASFKSALATLRLREIAADAGSTADIDTPEQLASARLEASAGPEANAKAETRAEGDHP